MRRSSLLLAFAAICGACFAQKHSSYSKDSLFRLSVEAEWKQPTAQLLMLGIDSHRELVRERIGPEMLDSLIELLSGHLQDDPEILGEGKIRKAIEESSWAIFKEDGPFSSLYIEGISTDDPAVAVVLSARGEEFFLTGHPSSEGRIYLSFYLEGSDSESMFESIMHSDSVFISVEDSLRSCSVSFDCRGMEEGYKNMLERR